MIYFCACTKSSSSPTVNPKHPDNLKSCNSCGGKLPVERGAHQGIMLTKLGLDQSNVIRRHLSWKTASNGRRRSLRRARTSFTSKRMDSNTKNLKASKDLTNKDSHSRYMLASESEKVGVNILGRRFSDTVGTVPIKKRKLLSVHSPLPSHHSSLYSDSVDEQSASYQDALLTAKQHSHDVNLGCESERVEDSSSRVEKSDIEEITKKICVGTDFSGISILAAAASCDRNMGGEFMNVEFSTLKQQFSEVQEVPNVNANLSTANEKEDPQPQTSEIFFSRPDLSFKESCSSALHSKKSNAAKSDGSCNLETSVNSFQNVLNKTTLSSVNVKFHWDLNISAEEWDTDEVLLSSDGEVSNNVSEVGDYNAKLGNAETCMEQAGFATDSQSVNIRDRLVAGEQKVVCVSQVKTEVKLGISGNHLTADSKESKPFTHTRCLQAEENVPLCADSRAVKSDEKSLVCRLAKKSLDGNACEDMLNGSVIFGRNKHMKALDETDTDNADKANKEDTGHGEMTAVEVKKDTKLNLPYDEIDAAKNDFPANIDSEIPICKPTGNASGILDASPALSSQEVCINNEGQVALENDLESHYYSDASQNNDDLANRMEKVEFLGDDDSQYEEGEFRQPLANFWVYGGAGEEENEHVDYGSDTCEAAPDFSSFNQRGSDTGFSDASCDNNKCKEVRKGAENASSQSSTGCPSLADILDSSSGKGNAENVISLGFEENLRARANGNDFIEDRLVKGVMKTSRLDRSPDGYRSSCNGRFGSINRNQNDASLYPPRISDSLDRVVGLSLRRNSSSQIEMAQSSDMSRRKSNSQIRLARSNERNEFNPRVEGDRDDPSSIGTRGSQHFQGGDKGKGDQWVNSPNHHGNSRRDSFRYYGRASFSHHGSRNGSFIVSDGTPGNFVGKVCSQNTHQRPTSRRSPIAKEGSFGMSSRPGPSREVSPDRPTFVGRDMPCRMDGVLHRGKYRGPLLDDFTDSSSSMHHTTHGRECNFSPPHRRHPRVAWSHSRSPSRPRTRPPYRCISPSRRRNTFPKFKYAGRIGSSRAGFGGYIANCASLSRNHTSLPHDSRWIDGRKEVPEDFGYYENWRFPGRRPRSKVFARSHRFDLMDSPERLEPYEHAYPMNSGRYHESVGFGRGSIHDGECDNRRKHDDRCEMPYSAELSVNDDCNGFMARNLRPKSSELQRRENSRAFSRCAERQRGDSRRKSKEEKRPL